MPRQTPQNSTYEYRQELESAHNLETGEVELCVRLRFRRWDTRRWSTVLVFSEYTSVGLPHDVAVAAIDELEARQSVSA